MVFVGYLPGATVLSHVPPVSARRIVINLGKSDRNGSDIKVASGDHKCAPLAGIMGLRQRPGVATRDLGLFGIDYG